MGLLTSFLYTGFIMIFLAPALAHRCHHHTHEGDESPGEEEPDGALAPNLLEHKNAPAAADDERGLGERVADALTQRRLQR